MKKNQHGFAVLELLLILIIVGLLGGMGWYVWHSSKKSNDSFDNAAAANDSTLPKVAHIGSYEDCLKSKTATTDKDAFPQTCTTKADKKFSDPDPSANWKEYESKAGEYSLKYPAAWDAKVCEPTATDLTLFLGPTKASSAVCSSGHPGQIWVTSTPAVPTESEQTLGSGYSDQTSKSVKVDGVTGARQSGKLKAAQDGPSPIPAGTLIVRYFFLTPGRSYIFAYVQAPSGDYLPDNLAEFDHMVQKTTTFDN